MGIDILYVVSFTQKFKDLYPRIEKRANSYTMDYIRNTMSNYSSVKLETQHLQAQPLDAKYTLLPIWMFCYDHEHCEHNFYMNGQTGKIVGKPPISTGKIVGYSVLFTLITFIIIKVIMFMLGGVWF